MIDIEKKVIVLCYANFCRSPVAEKILNQKGFKKIEFTSYGIDPLPYSKMDDRSINYLSNINIIDTNHIPRKITHTAIKNSSLVLNLANRVHSSEEVIRLDLEKIQYDWKSVG